jgi:hypothetical protein
MSSCRHTNISLIHSMKKQMWRRARYTILCDKVCDRSVVFSGSSTNKSDRHDITEILLKVALNSIKQTQLVPYTLMSTWYILPDQFTIIVLMLIYKPWDIFCYVVCVRLDLQFLDILKTIFPI